MFSLILLVRKTLTKLYQLVFKAYFPVSNTNNNNNNNNNNNMTR